ncbi:MAG TPA: methyltransferase domain-containing protein [Bryobacteraceae bacterium]|nr:methyltransferase domain-containing protein [Bryobacteraceae bacterium]
MRVAPHMVPEEQLGAFTCNICGARNTTAAAAGDREQVTCSHCRSSIRFRSIVLALSRALFGLDLKLSGFPVLKSVRGLGISDSDVYSGRLETRFTYTNTFYHRDPAFDLSRPDEKEFGKYDFVICSEVLEHVPAPVDRAFTTLGRLLKPAGVLILTVPYSLDPGIIEHYPGLTESAFAEFDGRTVLVGRTAAGEYRVFDRLTFHGGTGATLERRIFSDEAIRAGLSAAGFSIVRFDPAGNREFGVIYSNPCSLPVIALRAPFALSSSGVTELVEQLSAARAIRTALESSRWLRLGKLLGLGPNL